MVKVALFHSAGYTESGALQQFLGKISKNLRIERCFPSCKKPSPKLGRNYPEPNDAHSGCTGQALIDAMCKRLKEFGADADVILLVDDADCRFRDKQNADVVCAELYEEMKSALGKDIPFIALFAAQELESWLYADWSRSFKSWYGNDVAFQLARKLKEFSVPKKTEIELYGFPEKSDQGCSHKLSSVIQNAMLEFEGKKYSKRYDGVEMLANLNPATVAESCSMYFKPAYAALRQLAEN